MSNFDGPDSTEQIEPINSRFASFAGQGAPLPFGYLLVVGGPSRGAGVLITSLPVVIGRSRDAELPLADESTSRQHAELLGTAGHLVVHDLDSVNGTQLNGHEIAGDLHVRDGDLLTLGSSTVLVKTFT